MAARVRGLSPADVQAIRDGVAAGRRPKVEFTEAAGQIAGQLGQVVSVGDPADADEFVVVRFGRDELPFSPGDLRVAPKGAAARKAAAPAPAAAAPVRVEPEFVIDKPVVPPSRRPVTSSSTTPPVSSSGSPPSPAVSSSVMSGEKSSSPASRRKAARPKGPAGLTVTLAYAEGEWTVAASQGAKTLARPYVVKPAEALRMVSLVDVPGVQEAVAQILAAEREEAERAAERLRAELAEVEARLAELREAG